MRKILIVDDVKANRIILARMAENVGYITFQASDGLVALAILESNSDIDCVVTDCQMPNLDGPGLLAKIREKDSNTPIIVYSSYLSILQLKGLIDKGASAILETPIEQHALTHVLHRFLC
jgi:CheY-like chemotaxis protein